MLIRQIAADDTGQQGLLTNSVFGLFIFNKAQATLKQAYPTLLTVLVIPAIYVVLRDDLKQTV